MRTLEQRLKFDLGLTLGRHRVRFTRGERHVDAIVDIGPRGAVSYLKRPEPGQMYSSWQRVKGDVSVAKGAIMVWAAREHPEVMALFEAPIAATLDLS